MYFPSDHVIKQIWKKLRKVLWASQYSDNTAASSRHRIRQGNVVKPRTAGVLGLISPQQSSVTAAISSILALFDHCNFHPASTLNLIDNLRSNKQHSLLVMNATNIRTVIRSIPHIFPTVNTQFMDRISSSLKQLELDKQVMWNCPTYRHAHSKNRHLFYNRIPQEQFRLHGQKFATVASLCKRSRTGLYNIQVNSDELQNIQHSNLEEYVCLTNLHKRLVTLLPESARKPYRPKFPRETWAS